MSRRTLEPGGHGVTPIAARFCLKLEVEPMANAQFCYNWGVCLSALWVDKQGLSTFRVSNNKFDPTDVFSRSHRDTEMHKNEIGTMIVDCAVHLHQEPAHKKKQLIYLRLWGMKLGIY